MAIGHHLDIPAEVGNAYGELLGVPADELTLPERLLNFRDVVEENKAGLEGGELTSRVMAYCLGVDYLAREVAEVQHGVQLSRFILPGSEKLDHIVQNTEPYIEGSAQDVAQILLSAEPNDQANKAGRLFALYARRFSTARAHLATVFADGSRRDREAYLSHAKQYATLAVDHDVEHSPLIGRVQDDPSGTVSSMVTKLALEMPSIAPEVTNARLEVVRSTLNYAGLHTYNADKELGKVGVLAGAVPKRFGPGERRTLRKGQVPLLLLRSRAIDMEPLFPATIDSL